MPLQRSYSTVSIFFVFSLCYLVFSSSKPLPFGSFSCSLFFFFFFMANSKPSIKDVLVSFGEDRGVYLYVPLKRTNISIMVIDHLVKEGEHKRYPSLMFHPLPHALRLTAATDSLASFYGRNPTITIGTTKLRVAWSQKPKAPHIPLPKPFKIRIYGIRIYGFHGTPLSTVRERSKIREVIW